MYYHFRISIFSENYEKSSYVNRKVFDYNIYVKKVKNQIFISLQCM